MFKIEDAIWAANPRKVERAISELTKTNRPVTEEAVKELYLKFGGLVIGAPETTRGVPEELRDARVNGVRDVIEKPKRKAKE